MHHFYFATPKQQSQIFIRIRIAAHQSRVYPYGARIASKRQVRCADGGEQSPNWWCGFDLFEMCHDSMGWLFLSFKFYGFVGFTNRINPFQEEEDKEDEDENNEVYKVEIEEDDEEQAK